MRTEWMLSLTNKEYNTITEAVKHHMSESIHLFANLPNAKTDQTGDDRGGKRQRNAQAPPQHQSSAPSGSQQNHGKGKGKSDKSNPKNTVFCKFYNTRGGCRQGQSCSYLHKCDSPGCNDPRPRHSHH